MLLASFMDCAGISLGAEGRAAQRSWDVGRRLRVDEDCVVSLADSPWLVRASRSETSCWLCCASSFDIIAWLSMMKVCAHEEKSQY